MADLGDIHSIDPLRGVWPFAEPPPEIWYQGVRWTYTSPLFQWEGWINDRFKAGYREDTAVPEQSRHMYVFEEGGAAVFVVDHRETNPNHDLAGHALEFAKKHPVPAAVIVGAVAGVGAILFKAVSDYLASRKK